jgi:hypothetical protein
MASVRKAGFELLAIAPLIKQLSEDASLSAEHRDGLQRLQQQVSGTAVCMLSYFPQGAALKNYREGEDGVFYEVSDDEELPVLEENGEEEHETINHDSAGSCVIF